MATVETFSVLLTPEFAAEIREVVAAGEYASTSELIRDALRTWRQVREQRAVAVQELGRLWREGLESGQSEVLDADDIKRRGRVRLARLQAPRP
jgi:antitoxin ParD1/3/4